MNRSLPKLFMAVLCLSLGMSPVLLTSCRKRPAANRPSIPRPENVQYPPVFYGHVQDQDGRPIDGAEIALRVEELVPDPTARGHLAPSSRSVATFSAYTGVAGSFIITMTEGRNHLMIEAIRKPNYEWVTDLAWTLGPPHNKGDNRDFTLAGRYIKCDVYEPDNERPAIFPLHLKGSNKPVGSPSRGGFDVDCNGRQTVNEPTAPAVPSTGARAPRTSKEREETIGAYLRRS